MESHRLIPDHRFGFRNKYATIEQIYKIAKRIRNDMEAGRYYRTVFLGVLQAFDKIWHEGLLYKIKNNFLIDLDAIIRSYLLHCTFRIKYGEVWIKSGVPQGNT
jgi:hypothetical protein